MPIFRRDSRLPELGRSERQVTAPTKEPCLDPAWPKTRRRGVLRVGFGAPDVVPITPPIVTTAFTALAHGQEVARKLIGMGTLLVIVIVPFAVAAGCLILTVPIPAFDSVGEICEAAEYDASRGFRDSFWIDVRVLPFYFAMQKLLVGGVWRLAIAVLLGGIGCGLAGALLSAGATNDVIEYWLTLCKWCGAVGRVHRRRGRS